MNTNKAPNTTETPTTNLFMLPKTPVAPLGVVGVDLAGVLGVAGESEGVEGVVAGVDGVEGVVDGVDGVDGVAGVELSLTSIDNFMPDWQWPKVGQVKYIGPDLESLIVVFPSLCDSMALPVLQFS